MSNLPHQSAGFSAKLKSLSKSLGLPVDRGWAKWLSNQTGIKYESMAKYASNDTVPRDKSTILKILTVLLNEANHPMRDNDEFKQVLGGWLLFDFQSPIESTSHLFDPGQAKAEDHDLGFRWGNFDLNKVYALSEYLKADLKNNERTSLYLEIISNSGTEGIVSNTIELIESLLKSADKTALDRLSRNKDSSSLLGMVVDWVLGGDVNPIKLAESSADIADITHILKQEFGVSLPSELTNNQLVGVSELRDSIEYYGYTFDSLKSRYDAGEGLPRAVLDDLQKFIANLQANTVLEKTAS